jgi:hypothetical protein
MTKDDTAALLKAIDDAQSSTRVRLLARLPELSLLVAAGSVAAAVGHWDNRRDVAEYLAAAAILTLMALKDGRRRHHLGGRIDRVGWFAIGLVLVSALAVNLALNGGAQDAATAACLGAGLLLLAVADRSLVLVIPVAFIAAAVLAGQGAVSTALSFAAGLLCVLVVKRSQRRGKAEAQ